MNNPKYLPLKFIAGGLEVMVELAPSAECCRRGALSTEEYEITNVQYVCDIVDFTDEFDNMFRQQMASEGVNLHFDHYKSHVASIDSQQPRIQLSERTTSLKSVLAVMRLSTNVSLDSANSLGDWKSSSNTDGTAGLSKYSFTLGAERYPRFDLDAGNGSCRAYSEAQKAFGVYGDVGSANQIKYYASAKDGATVRLAAGSGPLYGTGVWAAGAGAATNNVRILPFTNGAGTAGQNHMECAFAHKLRTGQRLRLLDANGATVAGSDNAGTANVAANAGTAGLAETYYIAQVLSSTAVKITKPLPTASGSATFATYLDCVAVPTNQVFLFAAEDENGVSVNSDADFFIGQNFEVHNEGGLLRTGLDVTAAVPLHVEMEFEAQPSGLRLDAFVHTDKVAQLGADGLFVVAN